MADNPVTVIRYIFCSPCGGFREHVCIGNKRQCAACCSYFYVSTWSEPSKPLQVYLVGALKNEQIPVLAAKLRAAGYSVFDDWFAAGERADTIWRDYELQRGRSFKDALKAPHAQACFTMDKTALDASDVVVLVMPAGKSAHIELGYAAGKGKTTVVLMDEPTRFDVMYLFADAIVETHDELLAFLKTAEKVHASVSLQMRQV